MVTPTRARTRKRSEGAHLESRYFSVPAQGHDRPKLETQMCSTTPTTSHFFQPKLDLDAILADPAFLLFYDDFISAMLDLYYAKPLLIQDYVSHSPWKVLIAVTLVNKTAGAKAIPVFFDIIQRWPNPAALADAPFSLLFETLKDLGLGQIRSQRLIDISQAFIDHPPRVDKLHPSRGKHTAVFITSDGSFVLDQVKYPPTPISHIPGCGPYALDSYRIFCAGGDEWKAVRPTDKELIKYLQWRWAVEAYRKWDQTFGPGESIDLDYVRALTATLASDSISRPC
ncbi:DNA glycosylase [Ganoderma leucocontextum]|nr:DNA glycosylase [Ganoderma leucocontextum]